MPFLSHAEIRSRASAEKDHLNRGVANTRARCFYDQTAEKRLEASMRRCLPILVMLTGVTLLGSDPAAAYGYGEAPWCALYDIGEGSSQERCEFRDFESCRQEIAGGNRGFCNHNPRWTGQTGQPKRRSPPRRQN